MTEKALVKRSVPKGLASHFSILASVVCKIASAVNRTMVWFGLVLLVLSHFQQGLSYIVAVSFIGVGNRRIRKKPPI